MNSHLNLFKTYAKKERSYQLENDLTRAFAICLQEDYLFSHEILRLILAEKNLYNILFDDYSEDENIKIDIQKTSSQISGFEYLIAVSVSEHEMDLNSFWNATHKEEYDPICDMFIQFKNVAIILEVKRDAINCTSQLFNQAFNIILNDNSGKKTLTQEKMKEQVIPIDLSWPKIMIKALSVSNFSRAINSQTRFLKDFIMLVEKHNYNWLPEPPIKSLSKDKTYQIRRRINSAVSQLANKLNLPKIEKDRIGIEDFPRNWAQEVLFNVLKGTGNLIIAIYPGNTKGQGWSLFHKEPIFNETVNIKEEQYDIDTLYHIKFTSWQSYFTGLWFTENELKKGKKLYTAHNFRTYTGRKKRETWLDIAQLLDEHLDFDWKGKCEWEDKVLNSGKSQFDISFGYEKSIIIPFSKLQELDTDKNNLENLTNYLETIFVQFKDNLLK